MNTKDTIVDVILNGAGLDVVPHMRLGATVLDWKSRGLPMQLGHVHATSSGTSSAVVLICAVELNWSIEHINTITSVFEKKMRQYPLW